MYGPFHTSFIATDNIDDGLNGAMQLETSHLWIDIDHGSMQPCTDTVSHHPLNVDASVVETFEI